MALIESLNLIYSLRLCSDLLITQPLHVLDTSFTIILKGGQSPFALFALSLREHNALLF